MCRPHDFDVCQTGVGEIELASQLYKEVSVKGPSGTENVLKGACVVPIIWSLQRRRSVKLTCVVAA